MFVENELTFKTNNHELIVLLSKPVLETELRISDSSGWREKLTPFNTSTPYRKSKCRVCNCWAMKTKFGQDT